MSRRQRGQPNLGDGTAAAGCTVQEPSLEAALTAECPVIGSLVRMLIGAVARVIVRPFVRPIVGPLGRMVVLTIKGPIVGLITVVALPAPLLVGPIEKGIEVGFSRLLFEITRIEKGSIVGGAGRLAVAARSRRYR